MSGLGDRAVPGALPWRVLLLTAAIGGFGLVVLSSAAGGAIRPWALPQGERFAVLLIATAAISRLREAQWRGAALPLYAAVLVMLVAVEAIGAIGGGSRRWLDLGPVGIQPSELMKPAIVLALARFYDRLPPGELRGAAAVWPALALIALPVALVLVQPDLGTALMIAAAGLVVAFLAGLPLRLFAGAAVATAAALPLALTRLHGYQHRRLAVFLSPGSDPLGAGYHIAQSKIAIGSGGVFGKGFLMGTQSRLDYLPEGHTDFVFATMAEDWGLAGGLLLLAGYAALVAWGMRVALAAETRFARLAAAGLATSLFLAVAVNMAMVTGLAPVVGVPLPLVSFGGSAMTTVMLSLGVLMSLDRQRRARIAPM